MKKRLLALMLAGILFAVCFVGCDGGEVDIPVGTDVTTDAPVSDIPESDAPDSEGGGVLGVPMTVWAEGEVEYSVIYPYRASDDVKAAALRVVDAIKALGGRAELSSDWALENSDTSEAYEILIGETSRPETAEIIENMGRDDYSVKYVRNKIVIAAKSAERLAEAVEYFCGALTYDGGKVICSDETEFFGDKKYFFDGENSLENYRIVYAVSAWSKENAKKLADAIKRVYGVELALVTDRKDAVEREIVVGQTNREISRAAVEGEDPYSYLVKVMGKSIYIGADSDLLTSHAVDFVISEMEAGCGLRDYLVGHEVCVPIFANDVPLAEGADIRVFSFNVLFDTVRPAEERQVALGAILESYSPDVIGLQEMRDFWHEAFDAVDGGIYKIVDSKNEFGQVNNTALAYNSEKVKVIDHGVMCFEKSGSGPHIRNVSWACFERLEDGKRFVVANTHWDTQTYAQYVMGEAEEMAAFVLELEKKYDCPIITVGDYNRRDDTAEYKRYVELTGFHNSKYSAAVKGRVGATSHGSYGVMPKNEIISIDHIFGSERVEFLYFTVMVDQIVLDASDHCPIYADIKLN